MISAEKVGVLAALVVLLAVLSGGAWADASISLTPAEKTWLEQHSKIRVGVMNAWPPFDFVDAAGRPRGIGVDLIGALNKRLDGVLEIFPGPWDNLLEDVKEKRLDALLDITPTPAREQHYNFTTPYLTVPHVIVARRGGTYFDSQDDLAGRSLALERDFGNVRFFRENYPEITVSEYESTSAALGAVARGEVDAYAGNRAVAIFLMEREVMTNLVVQGRLKDRKGSVLAIGTRKDLPILRDILQKALDDIDRSEASAILQGWVKPVEAGPSIELTEAERSWLDTHKTVRVMIGTWPPFQYVEDGEPKGLAIEYVTKILEDQGLEVVPVAILWADALSAIDRFEKVDVLPTVARSPEREKIVEITRDYLSFPSVIVNRTQSGFVSSLEDLHGKTVAVERNLRGLYT